MTRPPEPPAVGGVPASIAAIMAAIRNEVVAPRDATPAALGVPTNDVTVEEVPFAAHPIAGVPTTDGRLDEVPFTAHPIPGVPTTGFAPDDATVRAMLAPLLKAWLDAHLPEIVETAVHAEIARLTGQG